MCIRDSAIKFRSRRKTEQMLKCFGLQFLREKRPRLFYSRLLAGRSLVCIGLGLTHGQRGSRSQRVLCFGSQHLDADPQADRLAVGLTLDLVTVLHTDEIKTILGEYQIENVARC